MKRTGTLAIVATAVLFPLFFQLPGGIYNSAEVVTDSGGILSQLPLPISILACLGGMLTFRNGYRRCAVAFITAGALLAVMLVSLVFAGSGWHFEPRKVLMLAQVMLPLMGLVLGQMVRDEEKEIPRAFFWVLMLVVPVQLAASWVHGQFALTHHLYVFSIYQHFQYVPVVFVCAFIWVMAALWDSHRKALYFLTPLMAIYAVASMSLLTGIVFFAFVIAFAAFKLFTGRDGVQAASVAVIALFFMGFAVVAMNQVNASPNAAYEPQFHGKMEKLEAGEVPQNLTERFADWRRFGGGMIESARTLMFGHPAPFPREVRTSAHNWYLDVGYNFGIITWLPILGLLGYTAFLFWRDRSSVRQETVWLGLVVLFLVVVDSNFKVTLRQPYPGIFAYFLWGVLLTMLHSERRMSFAVKQP